MDWKTAVEAVLEALRYFSAIQVIKALVEVLGKDTVDKILKEEC